MIKYYLWLFWAVYLSVSSAYAVPSPVLRAHADEWAAPVVMTDPVIKGTIRSGDTLSHILKRMGAQYSDINSILVALRKVYNPNGLTQGQTFTIEFEPGEARVFKSLVLNVSPIKNIMVKRVSEDVFLGFEEVEEIEVRLVKASGKINSSLYGAMEAAKIPAKLIMRVIKLSSYDVDFQREIRKGDRFTLLFEQHYTSDNRVVGYGEIIYSQLQLKNENIEMYRYQTRDERITYYDGEGSTVQKSFMRTPVDGARISSGYGVRKHPVLGYTRMHRGIDFAASIGTPIYAAGDGTITVMGGKGSYGKYVRIEHGNGYATAYAHLSRFRKGKQRGSRVKQGEIIGYVGKTGRVTGPHLHYELLLNGKQINPLTIKTTHARKLKSLERGIFEQYKQQVQALLK